MMTRMLRKLIDWINGINYRRVQRIMMALYPDPEERAYAYLGMGTETLDTHMFGHGEMLEEVAVIPDSIDGYFININDTGEQEVEL